MCFPPTIIPEPASQRPPLLQILIVGPFGLYFPISASERKQLIQPISVLRTISLQKTVKLLGLVIGVPSVSVIIEATPVALAEVSGFR